MSTVRLALGSQVASTYDPDSGFIGMALRLAVTTAMMNNSKVSGKFRYPHHKEKHDDGELLKPALLVSYYYLEPFLKNRSRYSYRDWVMDSGAFSAQRSGVEIDLQKYIDTCKKLLDEDKTLVEVYALDVIGDGKASLRNCEEMWRQGVEAIPTFHVGSPEQELYQIAKDYPKIALGGAVGYRQKDKWAAQCFARVWPKAIHGFGFGSETSIMSLPWHSVDATNWEIGPCKYGRWNTFGQMSVRGSKQNLRAEVEWYLDLERRARLKWKKEMAKIPEPSRAEREVGGGQSTGSSGQAAPSVRLVQKQSGRESGKGLE